MIYIWCLLVIFTVVIYFRGDVSNRRKLQQAENPLLLPACEVRHEYRNVCLVCMHRMCLSLRKRSFQHWFKFCPSGWAETHLILAAPVWCCCCYPELCCQQARNLECKRHLLSAAAHHSASPAVQTAVTPSPSPSDPLLPSVLFQKSSWRPNAEWFVPRLVARLTAALSGTGRFFTIKLTFSPDVLTDRGRWWKNNSTQQF